VFPADADGQGTLVVGAVVPNTTTLLKRETVQDASLRAGDAHFEVDLLCVTARDVQVKAFLDDNGNADSTEVQSSDYRDTCQNSPARYVPATVVAGETVVVNYELQGSCD